jgi:hypothetical protein
VHASRAIVFAAKEAKSNKLSQVIMFALNIKVS